MRLLLLLLWGMRMLVMVLRVVVTHRAAAKGSGCLGCRRYGRCGGGQGGTAAAIGVPAAAARGRGNCAGGIVVASGRWGQLLHGLEHGMRLKTQTGWLAGQRRRL